MRTGKPIFYTSADSVFQIACHEETYGLDNLLELCEIAREELDGYNIGRVIARPFIGSKAGEFKRTGNRRDLSLEPPASLKKHLPLRGRHVTAFLYLLDLTNAYTPH